MRKAVFLLALLGPPAVAAPPDGHRDPRPRATHVVVVPAELEMGGPAATLQPGVGVVVSEKAGQFAQVTLAAPVELRGTVNVSVLGKRLARDAQIFAPGGKVVGTVHAGALV